MVIIQSYEEYLSEISFEVVNDYLDLTVDLVEGIENKKGFVIEGEYDIYICRNFEPVKILNQIITMESTMVYNVIDAFGMIMFKGSAEEVVEYIDGFFSDDEEFLNI